MDAPQGSIVRTYEIWRHVEGLRDDRILTHSYGLDVSTRPAARKTCEQINADAEWTLDGVMTFYVVEVETRRSRVP